MVDTFALRMTTRPTVCKKTHTQKNPKHIKSTNTCTFPRSWDQRWWVCWSMTPIFPSATPFLSLHKGNDLTGVTENRKRVFWACMFIPYPSRKCGKEEEFKYFECGKTKAHHLSHFLWLTNFVRVQIFGSHRVLKKKHQEFMFVNINIMAQTDAQGFCLSFKWSYWVILMYI